MPYRTQQILGIPFCNEPVDRVVDACLEGGLVVVPSGPGLAGDLRCNADYRRAVTTADVAVTDSGAMVALWRLFRRQQLHRVSGLHLLEKLLARPAARGPRALFWVHPSEREQSANQTYLERQGFALDPADHAVAPYYPASDLADEALFKRIRQSPARIVVLCIGGGVQERLGWWLRERFREAGERCPTLLCTGAAIGFLSGNQVNIPTWADRCALGWFFRCLYEPRKFIPRYWQALPLIPMLLARDPERLPKAKNP